METTTVTVSNRGYIVLPAALRKELEIKAGAKMLLRCDNDKIILKTVNSFTDKLAGLTQQVIAKTADDVDTYIDKERVNRLK
ncbi:MAG: AbrB/MazE/SpoVT family DNA-binding domain-containing protein [Deltaproteobacteria bacterium]|nr:MAG: AbrB/MazE/SpoVT family DNA-binding domain-containing protein [Deltaproteobacteria bacterium]